MPSREYSALKRNVDALKGQFLNFGKRTDVEYTRYELTQCRAFVAFCHAEVENYLEEIASKIVSKAEKYWKENDRVTNAIAAMLVYRLPKEVSVPDDPTDQNKSKTVDTIISQAISNQKQVIQRNNGIKSQNLSDLFIPIGMRTEQFEGPLVIQLENLGERRGDQVHKNSQVSLSNLRDPFIELTDIETLISEIEAFDQVVKSLK